MATKDNLLAAIDAESKAHIRYVASQRIAENEGRYRAARLFHALAEAEVIHAVNHLHVLGEIENTDINIESAIAFENFEHATMYPQFIEQAEKDSDSLALLSFRGAMAGEQLHSELLSALKLMAEKDSDLLYYVCPLCGNITVGSAPESCNVCGSDGNAFKVIE
jgi:rubrerythrin